MAYTDPEARTAYNKRHSAAHHLRNREARNQAAAQREAADPVGRRARGARYRERHRGTIRKRNKDRMSTPVEQEKQRGRTLRRIYKMTAAEYDHLHAEQGGLCAICGQPETLVNRRSPDPAKHSVARLSVDHCHASGTVRALLCRECNSAIGLMQDDAARLEKAAAYLRRFA